MTEVLFTLSYTLSFAGWGKGRTQILYHVTQDEVNREITRWSNYLWEGDHVKIRVTPEPPAVH